MKALFLKRPFDIALSFVGLILSSPLWLLFGLMIWIEDRGPVFFKQERIGKDGRVFMALKFRSMIANAEQNKGPIQAKKNDKRITRVGKILRATAMDELPQLTNILKGDMSFVGPRALRPAEIENSENNTTSLMDLPGFEKRHSIRPGLTGLTQVYLPKDFPIKRKFRYDVLYINNRSFWLDMKLIFLSFWITFRAKWESREKKI
ncbi:MAG: sugar transferase [Candidatus Aminicenantes bacterium]|nr:MAG: sugar transferase [Candidatus Aminicenantes bacterium]